MPTFGVPLFSSSLAILMIAVDRYLLIVYPFKRRMNNRQAIACVAAILLLTVVMATPLFIYQVYKEETVPVVGITMVR